MKMLHAATNVNMILNFGLNIIDVVNKKNIELHILLSKFQPNKSAIQDDLQELNAISHESIYQQEMSINGIFNNLKAIVEIFILIKKIKPDIVYTRGSLMGYLGRFIAYMAGVKHIYHHQDDFYHREEKIGKVKRYVFKKIDLLFSKITTKLFFVSNTILEEGLKMGINKKKCIFVGHDLHPLFKNNINLTIEKRHKLISDHIGNQSEIFLVGTISRIEDFKGIDTIIEVAKKIREVEKNIKFLIRGNGSKFEKYFKLIDNNELSDTVFLIKEYLPANEIPSLFKSFDVFFLPTRREGFGMVFAEAMSMGVPVVCPKIYPVIEVVPNDLGFVIEPEDINGYFEAILDSYHNYDKRKNIAFKAQEYALNRWGSKRAAEKLVNEMLNDLQK